MGKIREARVPADVLIKSRCLIGRHVSVKGVRENNARISIVVLLNF